MSDSPPRQPTPAGERAARLTYEIVDADISDAIERLRSELPDRDLAWDAQFAAVRSSLAATDDPREWVRWKVVADVLMACVDTFWPDWRAGVPERPRKPCPQCSKQWPEWWNFCPRCGEVLEPA